MNQVKVMGHCPPDTDSTCSPIAYTWFLKKYKNIDAVSVVGGKLNKEAEFVLKFFGLETPQLIENVSAGDQLVLIDTNNPEELIAGWEEAEILEIVDHHKLYGLKTANIPTITVRPYGCVATVLWELMAEAHKDTPKEIAGILLACILSDTLKFTSPTTTDKDREAAHTLSSIAAVDIEDLATQMFDAKSNLDGMSARDILQTDAKDFDFNGKVYKIAVLETTNPMQALSKRAEIESEMATLTTAEGLEGILFFVIDIINSNATLIPSGSTAAEAVEKAFGVTRNGEGLVLLPGVVSRKKQIVPALEKLLSV